MAPEKRNFEQMSNEIPEMNSSERKIQKTKNCESQQEEFTETTPPTTLNIDDKISRFEYFLLELNDEQSKAVEIMFNKVGFRNFDAWKARVDFLGQFVRDGEENAIVTAGLRRLYGMLDEIMDVIRQIEQQQREREQQILDESKGLEDDEPGNFKYGVEMETSSESSESSEKGTDSPTGFQGSERLSRHPGDLGDMSYEFLEGVRWGTFGGGSI
jgi:hypothetical protein